MIDKNNVIVITGACGHIGSALIRNLQSYNVLAVDNFLTQRYSSLFNLDNNIKFIDGNFLDIELPEGCTVIHLAAITDAASSIKDSSLMEKININDTKQFIDKCILSKVSKFIFPSSTSVYGIATDVVSEDDVYAENPQSPYAESKLEIEKYLEWNTNELNYLILRFGTIFGWSPGMRFHTAVNKFCYQSALGLPITIWRENYEQFRPYLGLRDCIESIKLFLQMTDHSKFNTKYNVLSGNYRLDYIVSILKSADPSLVLNMVDTPLLNQYSYFVDDKKIKDLGYTTKDDIYLEILNVLHILRKLK